MDYQKLAEVIERAVENKVAQKAPYIRLGTVTSVSGNAVNVQIDGSASSSKIVKACTCAAGNRVVILREGTQFYAIGRIGD